MQRLFTIGVYGKTEEQFLHALEQARIDTFCDVRLRRGVRGSEYAYANSTRLQSLLAEQGIRYFYLQELAPTVAIRALQFQADETSHIAIRKREHIADAFRQRYIEEILAPLDTKKLAQKLAGARRAVLFCVEGPAAACHRSLAAERLGRDWNIPVEHLP